MVRPVQMLLGLAFIDKDNSALVLLTCGKGQCTNEKQLRELARSIGKKVKKLPAPPEDNSLLGGDDK